MSTSTEYEKIKVNFGYCGICCEKCFAFKNGKIKYHSNKLKDYLGNFDIYAKRFIKLLNEPKFEKYPDFKLMLDFFSEVNCEGCRKTEFHLYENCKVRNCIKNRKIDFCFQCTDFPCKNTGFDEHLEQRWIKINEKMKEIGLEKFHSETKNISRY